MSADESKHKKAIKDYVSEQGFRMQKFAVTLNEVGVDSDFFRQCMAVVQPGPDWQHNMDIMFGRYGPYARRMLGRKRNNVIGTMKGIHERK